jgi:DHA1 family bicyclomycin/chloramphenicol resistance-like MFS transporter
LYLPALPSLTEGCAAPVSQAQLTLTTLLLAFGISQLVWGPLSDRYGRRPVLLVGLGAYTLASIGCALAASMPLLIVWRTVQGAAMGAAVMGARAIVRDLYTPETGARVMSKGLTGLGVIACACAPLGGLLSDVLGWRYALTALAVFGALSLAVVALRFEETLAVRNPLALRPANLLATWLSILRHPAFLTYSALSTASYAGLFTFLAASSFVFIKVLGLSRTEYGLVMFSMALVYILGTFMCRRLLPRYGVRRSVAIAGALTLAGGTSMGGLAWAGLHNGWAIMLPYYLFMLAHGVHQPCGQSGAVGPFPHAAGAASALNGFLMMVAAFAVGGWMGTRLDGTVFPLTNGIWLWSVCIAAVSWTLVQRYGEPRRA